LNKRIAFLVSAGALLFIISVAAWAQENTTLPRFEDYPVTNHYQGKTAQPMIAKQDRRFRTRLREAAQEKPNFAGKYVFHAFGCGASCLMGFVLDAQTGKVVRIPFTICCWPIDVEHPIEFNLESSLLVFKGSRNEKGGGTYYYNFDGKRFVLVREIETGMPNTNP